MGVTFFRGVVKPPPSPVCARDVEVEVLGPGSPEATGAFSVSESYVTSIVINYVTVWFDTVVIV